MGWLAFIISSAVTLSLYDICKKHSVSGNRAFEVLLMTSASGFLSVLAVLAFRGDLGATMAIGTKTFLLLAAKSAIVGASWSFAYWALKTLPVTIMGPIRATGPIWTTLVAILFLSEWPTALQTAGFAITFAGCIAFSFATKREGFSLKTPSIILAILATLFGSASALYDKLLLQKLSIPPLTVLVWFMGGMCVIYLIACLIARKFDSTPLKWRVTIPAVGILLALSDFLYFTAISYSDARISIISTIRRTSTIGTFIIGGAIFAERNLWRKGLALTAILAGVILLTI